MITYNLQMVKFLLDRLVNQEICQVDQGGSGRDPWSEQNSRSVGGMDNVMGYAHLLLNKKIELLTLEGSNKVFFPVQYLSFLITTSYIVKSYVMLFIGVCVAWISLL
jgi:hypothetical protein